MAKYVFNASVFSGAPLYAATIATTVYVYNAATGVLAQIWEDYDGTDPKANPFSIDMPGKLQFYANEGRYEIVVQNGAESDTWEDVLLGPTGGGGGGGTVGSVVAGFGVVVDDSDASSPIVSSDFSASNTAASYTLAAPNDGQWMDLTGSSTINITCPPESSVNLGDRFVHIISNYSSGTVTIVAGSGVTVRPPPGGTLIVPQYATVGIKKADYATNTYIVFGPTEAA